MRAVALMQMARVHYARPVAQRWPITARCREQPGLAAALFEQAWAQFRRSDFGRVLGIGSLRFALERSDRRRDRGAQALSYYENCRYDEAVQAASAVLEKRSVYDRLSGALAAMPQGAQWLSQFLRRASLEDQVLARRLEQLALQPSIKRSIAIFEGAEEEYSRLLGVGLQPRDLSRLERVFKERFSALRAGRSSGARRHAAPRLARQSAEERAGAQG